MKTVQNVSLHGTIKEYQTKRPHAFTKVTHV